MRILVLTCFVACIGIFRAAAQNETLMQFFSTPTIYNPAMTGLINSDMRVAVNYGLLWDNMSPSPYKFINFSYDMPLLKRALPAGDALGVGLIYHYRTTSPNTYQNSRGLCMAYHKALGKQKKHHVSLGGQIASDRLSYYLF